MDSRGKSWEEDARECCDYSGDGRCGIAHLLDEPCITNSGACCWSCDQAQECDRVCFRTEK